MELKMLLLLLVVILTKSHIFRYLRLYREYGMEVLGQKTTNLPYPLMMLNQQSAGTQNAGLIAGGGGITEIILSG